MLNRRWLIAAALASALAGPARAELYRSVVVTDGDTIVISSTGTATGLRLRALGYDTPEIHGDCDDEKALAQKAKAKVIELARDGLDITSGLRKDLHGRYLVTLRLPDGRDLGALLIAAGLARPYDGKTARRPWCPGKAVAAPEIE